MPTTESSDGSSKSSSSSSSSLASARGTFIQIIVAAFVLGALWWALGPVIGQTATVVVVLALAILGFITEQTGTISIPFALSFAAVLALVVEFLVPGFVVSQFDPILALLAGSLGLDLRNLDALQFAVLSAAAIVVIWVVSARFGLKGYRKAKKPTTVAKVVRKRAERLVDTYFTIGRLAIAFAATAVIMLFMQGGILAGDLAGQLSEVPFVVANVLTALLGYLSLGGSFPVLDQLPLLGALSAGEFAVLVLGIIIMAAGVRYS